jgi:hypothetical protein
MCGATETEFFERADTLDKQGGAHRRKTNRSKEVMNESPLAPDVIDGSTEKR